MGGLGHRPPGARSSSGWYTARDGPGRRRHFWPALGQMWPAPGGVARDGRGDGDPARWPCRCSARRRPSNEGRVARPRRSGHALLPMLSQESHHACDRHDHASGADALLRLHAARLLGRRRGPPGHLLGAADADGLDDAGVVRDRGGRRHRPHPPHDDPRRRGLHPRSREDQRLQRQIVARRVVFIQQGDGAPGITTDGRDGTGPASTAADERPATPPARKAAVVTRDGTTPALVGIYGGALPGTAAKDGAPGDRGTAAGDIEIVAEEICVARVPSGGGALVTDPNGRYTLSANGGHGHEGGAGQDGQNGGGRRRRRPRYVSPQRRWVSGLQRCDTR